MVPASPARGSAWQDGWQRRFDAYAEAYPEQAAELTRRWQGELPAGVIHNDGNTYNVLVYGFGSQTGDFELAILDDGVPAEGANDCDLEAILPPERLAGCAGIGGKEYWVPCLIGLTPVATTRGIAVTDQALAGFGAAFLAFDRDLQRTVESPDHGHVVFQAQGPHEDRRREFALAVDPYVEDVLVVGLELDP